MRDQTRIQLQSRERAAQSRELDRIEGVPEMRMIDRAIADGVARLIAERYEGDAHRVGKAKDLCDILHFAGESLIDARYDMAHPIAKARYRARLRLASAKSAKRLPL